MTKYGMNKLVFSHNENINNVVLYLIILFNVMFNRDTMYTTMKYGFIPSFFVYMGVMVVLILFMVIKNFKTNLKPSFLVRKNETLIVGALLLVIVLSIFIKKDFQLYNFTILAVIIMAYCCTYIFDFHDFFHKYSNVMTFLAVFSLVTMYVLRPLLFPGGRVNYNLPILTNGANLDFYDLGFSFVMAIPHYYRNFGIFREPGVFQFFLIVALIYELFMRKNNKKHINVIIMSITVLSTFSTAGIIILMGVYAIYVFQIIVNAKNKKVVYKRLAIIAVIFLSVFSSLYISNKSIRRTVNESVTKIYTINESSLARYGSIFKNAKLFIGSPIIGNDFERIVDMPFANTTTSFSILALFGILGGGIHLYLYYNLSKKASKNVLVGLGIFVLYLLLLNTQFLVGNVFMWMLSLSPYMIGEKKQYDNQRYDV